MSKPRFVNPFKLTGNWYKANLHTHTTTSDGQLSPPDRIAQYRRAGYDVLALTDHGQTNDIRALSRGGSNGRMLVVSGMEYHPLCRTSAMRYHLVALNVPHPFQLTRPDDANHCARQVTQAGGLTLLAHPYWCGQSFADFRSLTGLAAVEVYNSTCARIGRGCSEPQWAYALEHGMEMPIVGVDDCHGAETGDVCECWTWLRMSRPTVANVLKAVRTGACYASCGPKIHDFRVEGGKVRLRCSPAQAVHFMGGAPQGARRRAVEGGTIRTFSIDKPAWRYVRAVVTDAAGRQAWTNPIFP